MAVVNPCGFLQNAGATHTAEQMRNWHGLLLAGRTGVASLLPRGGVNPGLGNQLQVTQTGSPSMAVVVKSGHATIPGTENGKQGVYSVLNDADVTLGIAAAHATLNRIDIVVFRVYDQAYSGSTNTSALEVITGTPASSPAAPSAPANSIVLAQVSVIALDTSITDGEITDKRQYMAASGGLIPIANATERDALSAYESLAVYRRDLKIIETYNGTIWESYVKDVKPWQNWTPSYTNLTIGNGTVIARYRQFGDTVEFVWEFLLGSTSAVGSSPTISLPVTAAADIDEPPLGPARLLDAGSARFPAQVCIVSPTAFGIYPFQETGTWVGNTASIAATTPFTWEAGDAMMARGWYEPA